MSIQTYRWTKAVGHAWIWWSQPDSPHYDPEKALRLFDRRGETITTALTRMKLRELLPQDQEVLS